MDCIMPDKHGTKQQDKCPLTCTSFTPKQQLSEAKSNQRFNFKLLLILSTCLSKISFSKYNKVKAKNQLCLHLTIIDWCRKVS